VYMQIDADTLDGKCMLLGCGLVHVLHLSAAFLLS